MSYNPSAVGAQSKKILIVEDEHMLREAYERILKFEGYTVYAAMDGSQALSYLKKYRPHLILLDVLMPVMDGYEFLRQARIKEKYPKVTVVALTNLSDQKNLEDLNKLGVTHHVLKSSYSPKELVAKVRTLLGA
jgi:CheY-like chemotaxis protein